ncbi:MAG: KUP/HAK/KT family potassium transporter [Flavobacteriales bacterium]
MSSHMKKLSAAGVLVSLGIVFGDIGTSPLYVLKAIIGTREISPELVLGGISCVFWTLTIQTTFKYIILTLKADNNGEGGIFSLYALVRRRGKWLFIPAIIGAGTLLGDGIITPPISVASAIEGLEKIHHGIPVVEIVIAIITVLFIFQRFGTKIVGATFGPIMLVWFGMLAVLGLSQIIIYPDILKALSPHYAYDLLVHYPQGFWLLGAVFLCTTGAEALYSDLGHCGRQNIQISWVAVKVALILNYCGQGAWLLHSGNTHLGDMNPFYEIMPRWFLVFGISIATAAAIIASQALISGSFTLISEAVSLNFWPRITIKYPTDVRGQIYIPSINWLLWAGCVAVMLYFEESSKMEAAYGLFITITMLMTTILISRYLIWIKKWSTYLVYPMVAIFVSVELSFLIANLSKLSQMWLFLAIGLAAIFVMYVWYKSRKINNKMLNFVKLKDQIDLLRDLSQDQTVTKFATHCIYLTKADLPSEVEQKIIYSIFSHTPKRADIYWFVHIERTDDPYHMEYSVQELENDKVIRVEFKLGFKVQPRIGMLFRKVVDEMVANGELDIKSKYPSLKKYNLAADFKFVILEKFLSYENEISFRQGWILNVYFAIKQWAQANEKAFGLDPSETHVEKIPLLVNPVDDVNLCRKD